MMQKFRVFAKAGVEAVYGGGYDRDQMFYEIRDIDFYDNTITVWGCHNKDCGMCDDTYKMEDVEIMMATGIKDEENIEIYEGDIVEYFHELAFIKRVKRGFVVVRSKGYQYTTELHGHMKVLGNVYENPELLEVADLK